MENTLSMPVVHENQEAYVAKLTDTQLELAAQFAAHRAKVQARAEEIRLERTAAAKGSVLLSEELIEDRQREAAAF